MTTSGTVSTTVFNTGRVIDHAYRRCRVPPETVTSEMLQIAKDNLYLLFSMLPNMGITLWTIEKYVLPFYQGQANITLPVGTIDVQNFNYRTISRYTGATLTSNGGVADYASDNDIETSCAQTAPNGSITTLLDTPVFVSTLGVNMKAAGTYTLVFEWSNDLVSWTTVLSPGAVAYTAGQWHWYDLDPQIDAQYWRVRETGGATLNVAEFVVAGNPNEIPFARLNQDDYTNLPNKAFQGRPLQFWLDRKVNQPVMRLWPVPNAAAAYAQCVVWVERYIQDVGTLTQEIEVPQRWYDAIVSQLALKLAIETPQVDPAMIDRLTPIAANALALAQMEERDNSPIMWTPNIAPYTR
jgi:hypothetical protein